MIQLVEIRSFHVHAGRVGAHDARIVREASFEAAAVAYAEDLHLASDETDEVRLIVRDLETGHEHCFKMDLANGDTAACD